MAIANSIATVQKTSCDSIYYYKINQYRNLREEEVILDEINAYAQTGDTLFFVEYFCGGKPITNVYFWVKNRPESFMAYDGECHVFRNTDDMRFSLINTIRLCEAWDIRTIRDKEEKREEDRKEGRTMGGECYMMATRLILKPDKEFSVDCTFFRTIE